MKTLIQLSLLTLGISSFTGLSFAVQVDGHCYLENQSNHQGTKILFEADSPTAVTDSTYTQSSGYYSIDLEIGIYNIFYIHEGYGSESIYHQLLTAPTTMADVTLPNVPQGIHITGSLSGTLEDTTYIVEGDIFVDYDSTLIIETGAVFYFLGDEINLYYFYIQGRIFARGTETDSIKFMPAVNSPGWRGITIYSDCAIFEYCVIIGCSEETPLYLTSDSYYDSIMVRHCTVMENPTTDEAICCGSGNGVIRIDSSIISGNGGDGISCGNSSRVHISNCIISGNSHNGIELSNTSSELTINHCVITDNGDAGIDCFYGTQGVITKCNIVGNATYGIFCDNTEDLYILNTIIESNGANAIYFDDISNTSTTYCNFYNNVGGNFSGNSIPQALGQVVTVNANGDSCDVYANIFLDPLFVNPSGGDYHLQSTSPCIDAGDPTSPLDPDNTIADIGAFYFNQLGVINNRNGAQPPSTFRLLPCYPNPFNSTLTIPFTIPFQSDVQISIYNLLGQKIHQVIYPMLTSGIHQIQWNPSSNASGLYFIQLISPNGESQQKVLLIK